jgi:hypothetical protein
VERQLLNEHLRLLNGLIGFASSVEGWPKPLQEQGYVLYWVGPSYLASNGRKSNPDLLFVSKFLNHCLIFECKSGISADNEQLETLVATTKEDLIQGAQVSFPDPKNAEFDIVIVCSSDKFQSLSKTLDGGNYGFPVLVVNCSTGYVHIERATLKAEPISTTLRNGFKFDNDIWPLEFIPYDETSELSEIASVIMPKVVSIMKSGRPHFDTDDIIRDTCPVFETLHPKEKTELTRKVRSILQLAKKGEFSGLLTPMPGGAQYKDKWIVSEHIKVGNVEKKVGVRSLQKRVSQFISRVKKGVDFTGFKEESESWQYEWKL